MNNFFKTIAIIVIILIAGWINNINYVLDSDLNDVDGREVVSIVGIFIVPIGSANGVIYFFEDEKEE